jgi:FkbM family methyltransferase
MLEKIKNRINKYVSDFEFKIFKKVLKKYDVDFYFKDRKGFLTKRLYNENFAYIFPTKNASDAFPMMDALDEKIKNTKICIDVGANIGVTSMWMARQCQNVYAFEPAPENVERFHDNMAVNNVANVELIQKAVSRTNGVTQFNLFASHGHHSLDPHHLAEVKEKIDVEIVTLDHFCTERGINEIDVLKIDVEGCEIDVLMGAKDLLRNKSIKMIIFENSPILFEKQNKDKREVIHYLTDSGYDVFRLDGSRVSDDIIDNLIQEDLYATHT